MQRAACNVQRATCSMEHAACNVQHATCNIKRAAWNMQHATCNVQHEQVSQRRQVPSVPAAIPHRCRTCAAERAPPSHMSWRPSIRCKAVRSAPLVAAPVYVRATRRAYPCCRGRACARVCMHVCTCASALACAAGCAGMRLAAAMKRGSAGRTRSAALTPTACTTNRSCATAFHSRVPRRAGCRVGHRVTWDIIPHGRVAWATSAKDGMSRTTMLHGIPCWRSTGPEGPRHQNRYERTCGSGTAQRCCGACCRLHVYVACSCARWPV